VKLYLQIFPVGGDLAGYVRNMNCSFLFIGGWIYIGAFQTFANWLAPTGQKYILYSVASIQHLAPVAF